MKEINSTRNVTLVSYRWEKCFISDSRKWKLGRLKLNDPTKSLNEKVTILIIKRKWNKIFDLYLSQESCYCFYVMNFQHRNNLYVKNKISDSIWENSEDSFAEQFWDYRKFVVKCKLLSFISLSWNIRHYYLLFCLRLFVVYWDGDCLTKQKNENPKYIHLLIHLFTHSYTFTVYFCHNARFWIFRNELDTVLILSSCEVKNSGRER